MKKTSIAIMLSSLLLSACGDSESNNIAPTASFTLADDLHERAEFTIDGTNSSSDSNGSISTYYWTIDLGEYRGENIYFTSNNANAKLIIGEISEDVTATITLTVTDNKNLTDEFSRTVIISELDVAMLPPMPTDPDLGLTGTDSDNRRC